MTHLHGNLGDRRARGAQVSSASSAASAVIVALARLRVPLGFVAGALVLWLAQPTATTVLTGTAVAILGECLRIWASGHLNKGREVTSSGPYRWFAHPLYVGSCIIGAGLAVASDSVAVAILIVVYLAVTLTAAIKSEEAFLRRTFGDRYDRYRRGTSEPRRFSLERAMANREHRAVVGLTLAVLLLALKATYNGSFWGAAGPQ
jgi:protein-S-isoprenylcysteine O-methyltransferase Ste14